MVYSLKTQKLLDKRHTLWSPVPSQQLDLPRREQLMNHCDGNWAMSLFFFFLSPSVTEKLYTVLSELFHILFLIIFTFLLGEKCGNYLPMSLYDIQELLL